MDKRLQKVIFLLISGAALFAGCFSAFAQVPEQTDQLRIQLWTDIDSFPGIFGDIEDDGLFRPETAEGSVGDFNQHMFDFSIQRLKEMAPFFMEAMLYGWTYDYVPSDKVRKVAEIFETDEIQPFNPSDNRIEYHDPVVKEGKLYVWAYCNRTDVQKFYYKQWDSVDHPRVHGTGRASVEEGVEGIKQACYAAVKNAVREYWRIYEKNKPKEIEGKVLLIGDPRVYISEGRYVVDLDFFLETDRIVRYSIY